MDWMLFNMYHRFDVVHSGISSSGSGGSNGCGRFGFCAHDYVYDFLASKLRNNSEFPDLELVWASKDWACDVIACVGRHGPYGLRLF